MFQMVPVTLDETGAKYWINPTLVTCVGVGKECTFIGLSGDRYGLLVQEPADVVVSAVQAGAAFDDRG